MGDVVYGWTGGAEDSGLPFPIPDQSSPNAARDIRFLAERIQIDADDPNLPTFANIGPPLHFYGEGRPDTEYPELINAPMGSTFTCTSDKESNFGARVWTHTTPVSHHGNPWICVEGHTPTWTHNHAYITLDAQLSTQIIQSWGVNPSKGPAAEALWSLELAEQMHVLPANSGAGAINGTGIMRISPNPAVCGDWIVATGGPSTGGYVIYAHMGNLRNPGIHTWPTSNPTTGAARDSQEHLDELKTEIDNNPDHPDIDRVRNILTELEGQSDA